MIFFNICHIVVLKPPSGDAVLFNAKQSTAYSSAHLASNATDGDWSTYSLTDRVTGTHWWQVSMTNMIVYQIELKAGTRYTDEVITVSLYSGETLAGQCKSHTGGFYSTETLSCDRVAADRVKLSLSSTSSITATRLRVYEIKVKYHVQLPILTPGERHECYVMLCNKLIIFKLSKTILPRSKINAVLKLFSIHLKLQFYISMVRLRHNNQTFKEI